MPSRSPVGQARQRLRLVLLASTLLGLLLGQPATAGDSATAPFTDQERAAISSHYSVLKQEQQLVAQYHQDGKKSGGKSLAPSLDKKAANGNLPPGWKKKLKVGGILPPDVMAQAEALPPKLLAQLSAGPAGTLTIQVDGAIIRVVEATRTIVDFINVNL